MANDSVDVVIKRGQVVTSTGIRKMGVAIKDGKIAALASDETLPPAQRTVNAYGKFILPGLVDPECHAGSLRPLKDSFYSETRAAAAGGVTTGRTGARESLSEGNGGSLRSEGG